MVSWGANMPQPHPQPFFHDTPDNTSSTASSMPYHNEPFSADLAAAMAPVMPTLPPATDGMGGYNPGDVHDFVNLIPGWDLEGLGMGMGSQGMWEDGMRIFLEEPWFNTMFQGNPAAGNSTMNFQ
jgi:RalA-binding protein 1